MIFKRKKKKEDIHQLFEQLDLQTKELMEQNQKMINEYRKEIEKCKRLEMR